MQCADRDYVKSRWCNACVLRPPERSPQRDEKAYQGHSLAERNTHSLPVFTARILRRNYLSYIIINRKEASKQCFSHLNETAFCSQFPQKKSVMNKALRFVWLSLLTLVCGIASAGTVVFDPTVDTSSGQSITKNGITFELTSDGRTLDAADYNGQTVYSLSSGTYFHFKSEAPAGNITSVTIEYESAGGYIYDRNYYNSSETTDAGIKFTDTRAEGCDDFKFAIFSGALYVTKVIVEHKGDDPTPGGGDTGKTYTLDELSSGAADVASATIKFTDAQVVYADASNYILREGGKAIDFVNSTLNLSLGATVNGTVTVDFAYNGGITQAKEISGVTNANSLTQTGATGQMNPVTTTLSGLSSYKGDLVKLEQVTLYHDTYGDLGAKNAYYAQSGYTFALLSNAADFADQISSNASAKYDITAWYNALGSGMIGSSLQIVSFGGEEQQKPAAPVISGEQQFSESTLVTITAEDGATVYYTTDGSTPTEWTYKYVNPFTLTESATVKAVAYKNKVYSDVTELEFTKAAVQTGTTIAELHAAATSQDNVTLKLTDAKVVYAANGNVVLREDGKAIDLLNTSLNLPQGATVSGTVKLNVAYSNTILSASDIDGETNDANLTVTAGTSTDIDPVVCELGSVTSYPGDVIKVENKQVWSYSNEYYFYEYNNNNYNYFYFTNGDNFGLESGKSYTITAWFNTTEWGSPKGTIITSEPIITSLNAPYIGGDETFTDQTTVSISSESVATIHYTTDGSEPTVDSPVYTDPFTVTETTTVKALATYKSIVSGVATKTFTKVNLDGPKTIAELAAYKMNFDNVEVKFNNAQVVYAEDNNYIIREDGYALDVMSTTLPLSQGATVSGSVKLKVNFAPFTQYSNGILTTADLADETNADNLTVTAGESTDAIPMEVDLGNVSAHPGDLLSVKGASGWVSSGGTMFYTYNPYLEVYLTNGADYGIQNYGKYNAVIWYNSVDNYRVDAKIISCKKVITYLNAPVVSGNTSFYEETEVQIASEEGATIYYTVDGTEPTTESTVYTEPFTISESCTLKTFATYEDLVSPTATVEFTKKDLNGALTIAQLAAGAESKDSVAVYLKNAKVVYGETNGTTSTMILRDGGYALDVTNSALSFPVNADLSGIVVFKVDYNKGLLTATDIEGATNSYDISFTWPTVYDQSPLTVELGEVKDHAGDLLRLEGVEVWNYNDVATIYTYTPKYTEVKISNPEDFNIESGFYDLTVWYNDVSSTYYAATVKAISATKVEKRPDAPVIYGDENFVGKTTVSIAGTEGQNIYYTLDGTDPTTESTVYTDPFVITETTTVKAVAAYNGAYSDIVTKTFTKTGDYETKTIAQLHEGQQSLNGVYVSLNGAKVVYTENYDDGTHVAILRENGQALDLVSGVIDLPLGATVNGTYFTNITYANGIVNSYDVLNETNSYDLEYTMPEEADIDPVAAAAAEVVNYPGDLVKVEGLQILVNEDKAYAYTEDYKFFNLTDTDLLQDVVAGQKYTVVGWYNAPGTGMAEGSASLKVVKLIAEQAPEYNEQTIAELNARTDRENNIRLNLNNAKVVYVRDNLYYGTKDIALRQDGKAVVLYSTTLPLELNSTVSGSVKMNFYGVAGIPQLREIDGGVTSADDLEITAASSEELDPTEATFANVDEHRADLVVFRKVKIGYGESAAYAIEKDGQKIEFVNENEDLDVDALVSETDEYDVVLWYNARLNDAPQLEIVKAVKLTGDGIYGIDANYGENGNTYNLQGVKVNKNYRGVVVRDGKKFTQK